MTPAVASIRQNLQMLVDHGDVNPACATGGTQQWGSTIGQAAPTANVPDSASPPPGVEVYVGGPALSVCTLDDILKAAGVVHGMELDINPNWVTSTYCHPHRGGAQQCYALFPDERVIPRHHRSAASSRAFYTWTTVAIQLLPLTSAARSAPPPARRRAARRRSSVGGRVPVLRAAAACALWLVGLV